MMTSAIEADDRRQVGEITRIIAEFLSIISAGGKWVIIGHRRRRAQES